MHGSSILAEIIAAYKSHLAAPSEYGTGILVEVLPPRKIHRPITVTYYRAIRPIGEEDFAMIGTELDIRRKHNLIMFIAMHGNIGPVKHRLDHWSGIYHLDGSLHS